MKKIIDHSRARIFFFFFWYNEHCSCVTSSRIFLYFFFFLFFANIWRLKRSVPKEVRRLNRRSEMYRVSIDPSRCVSIRKCNRAGRLISSTFYDGFETMPSVKNFVYSTKFVCAFIFKVRGRATKKKFCFGN